MVRPVPQGRSSLSYSRRLWCSPHWQLWPAGLAVPPALERVDRKTLPRYRVRHARLPVHARDRSHAPHRGEAENGRWVVFRGRWGVERRDDFQTPPDPHVGGLIQIRIDRSGHGSSDEKMLRLLDAAVRLWLEVEAPEVLPVEDKARYEAALPWCCGVSPRCRRDSVRDSTPRLRIRESAVADDAGQPHSTCPGRTSASSLPRAS